MSKYVIITGAAGGLGQAVARLLASRGWKLALVSRQRSRLSVFDPLRADEALLIEADVSKAEGAARVFAASIDEFGTAPHALVHCAGTTLITPLHRTSAQQFQECVEANLNSAFWMVQGFVHHCLDHQQPGSAVLVSSVVARIGVANHEAIAACKGALESLIRSAAATYSSKGIRINGIAPGLMRSPLTERLFVGNAERQIAAQYPLGRYGSVEDGAEAIGWLLSDSAAWITGQILPVDGGFSAVRPMVRG